MKKYIAIHTYHDSDAKKRFWMGTKHNQTTDIEWAKKNGIIRKPGVQQPG